MKSTKNIIDVQLDIPVCIARHIKRKDNPKNIKEEIYWIQYRKNIKLTSEISKIYLKSQTFIIFFLKMNYFLLKLYRL